MPGPLTYKSGRQRLLDQSAVGPCFYTKEQETMLGNALGRTNGGYQSVETPGADGGTPSHLIRARRNAKGGANAESVGLSAHAKGWVNLGGPSGTVAKAGRPYDSGRWAQNG